MLKIKQNKLSNKIKEETGLEIEKYQTDELSEEIGDLITFPIYSMKIILKQFAFPILLILISTIYFMLKGKSPNSIKWFFFIGLFLSFIIALSKSLVKIPLEIKQDAKDINRLSFDIAEKFSDDIKQSGNKDSKLDFTDIMSASGNLVVIPVAKKIINKKLPLIAKPLNGFIGFLFAGVINIVNKDSKILELDLAKSNMNSGDNIDNNQFDKIEDKTNDLFDKIIGTLIVPLKMIKFVINTICYIIIFIMIFYMIKLN